MLLLDEGVKKRQKRQIAEGLQPQKFNLQPILTPSDLLKGAENAERWQKSHSNHRELLNFLGEAAALDANENQEGTDSTPEFIEDLPFISSPSQITESAPVNPLEGGIFEVNPLEEGASEFDLSELPAESTDRASEKMAIVKLSAHVLTR